MTTRFIHCPEHSGLVANIANLTSYIGDIADKLDTIMNDLRKRPSMATAAVFSVCGVLIGGLLTGLIAAIIALRNT